MNFELIRNFTAEEVEFALKQMKPLTAPGPDGMSPIFFKFCWQFIGQGVIDASLAILNSGNISANLNHTYIALIPKTKSLERATDFRPISLCNVLYKIESKTIANRLKKIMPKLVSESQSAFMLDRLITDNILVAHETLHHLKTKKNKKNKKTRKTGYMAIKLDMSKAYDRVEWVFLEKIMEKRGFDNRWISLIQSCIQTVSFSILVNGEPCGNCTPKRVFRQGDPLSPYLFFLCAKGLHSLLQQAESSGASKGVSLCSAAPKISHLFFADDSLLFCRVNSQECTHILDILKQYEEASGQQINRGKTQLFFSPNTETVMQEKIKKKLARSGSHNQL